MCPNCGSPTIRNLISFDALPLVEFIPEANVPPARVNELLRMDPPQAGGGGGGDGWRANVGGQE